MVSGRGARHRSRPPSPHRQPPDPSRRMLAGGIFFGMLIVTTSYGTLEVIGLDNNFIFFTGTVSHAIPEVVILMKSARC